MSGAVVTIGSGAARPVRSRFLRGPVRARTELAMRDALKPWGLPLHRYRFTLERMSKPTYQDHHGIWQGWIGDIPAQGTFTHRRTGARIVIPGIWLGGDGQVLQYGTQYGDLAL